MSNVSSVVINRPINKVVEVYCDPDRYKDWMDGFVSFEQLSGDYKQPGGITKYSLEYKDQIFVEHDIVVKNNLPRELISYSSSYVSGSDEPYRELFIRYIFEDLINRTSMSVFRYTIKQTYEMTQVGDWLSDGMDAGNAFYEMLKKFKEYAEKVIDPS